MVKRILILVAAAALWCGAGISRRRDPSGADGRDDDRRDRAGTTPAASAPAVYPGRVGIAPRRAERWSTPGGAAATPQDFSGEGGAPPASYIRRNEDGVRWYGRRSGPQTYWTRPYGGHWWRYDPGYARWNYWYGDQWWWYGPGGSMYLVVDEQYYPYAAPLPAPVVVAPATPGPWSSPDGRRMIELTGTDARAQLYDQSVAPPAYLAYLGRGVQRARFSAGQRGAKATILVDFADGTFAVFDEDGKRLESSASATTGAPPPNFPSPPPGGPPETAP